MKWNIDCHAVSRLGSRSTSNVPLIDSTPSPVARRAIQRTQIERERESGGELCRGEREYCYANWIPMTCHRSSLPIRGTLGNREFFPFPSYRKVFLLCPFLFPPPIHEYEGTVLESLLLFFLLVSLAPLSFSLLVSFVLYSDNMGGGRTVFWKSSNTLMRFRRQIRCKFHECSIPRKRGSRG